MKVLDLFSGIGGFSLGLERAGMRTAAFCEYDENARKVLRKNWPDVPIFDDVRHLTKELLHDNGIQDIGLICGDTHASLSASQDNGVAQKMTVTSGLKCSGLSKNLGPLGSLEKMLLGTSRWASTKCLLTWKAKATPQGRLLYQLVPSMLPTEEIESGLLHTPTAKANQLAPSMRDRDAGSWWRTPSADQGGTPLALLEGKTTRPSGHKIQIRLQDQVRMWTTPTAHNAKETAAPSEYNRNTPTLAAQVGGSLNPAWVEWLMGFPTGHTDLNNSETQ